MASLSRESVSVTSHGLDRDVVQSTCFQRDQLPSLAGLMASPRTLGVSSSHVRQCVVGGLSSDRVICAPSSWGGNALLGDDGLQHMFVAEIPGGLRTWGSQSQCVHATSPNISGPYTRHDLVLGPECHNPSTLRHPQTGEWLMFHIVSLCCSLALESLL